MRLKHKKIYAVSIIPLLLTASGVLAMQSWQQKPRFADPPRRNETYAASERDNKLRAAEWVNSDDPSYVRLRSEIDGGFPLWARGNAINVAPGSFTVSPGRFAGELNISYTNNLPNGKKYSNMIQAQIVDGRLCLGHANTLYKVCDDIPASQAEAEHLNTAQVARNAENIQEAERAKQESVAIIAGSRTRRPGSPLNVEDEACMKTFSENYQEYMEGECTVGYYTQISGNYICTGHSGRMVTRTRDFEKNICNRPISFRDQCGSTIRGSYSIRPGARFDRKFGYPCGRIY